MLFFQCFKVFYRKMGGEFRENHDRKIVISDADPLQVEVFFFITIFMFFYKLVRFLDSFLRVMIGFEISVTELA